MTTQIPTTIMKNHGFSLVELMISITIGLILVISIGTLYVSNVKAFGNQSDDSQLQETARAAFDVIGYHIRLAGFADIGPDLNNTATMVTANGFMAGSTTYTMAQFYAMQDTTRTSDMLSLIFGGLSNYSTGANAIHGVAGCEGLFSPAASFATFPWACSTTAGPSSITLSYQVQPAATSGGVPTGAVRSPVASQDSLPAYNSSSGAGGDCGGNNVASATASPSGPLAINRFYIDATTSRLMCLGNGDTSHPKPIAEGVMDMRILYGVIPTTLSASLPNDGFVGRYVTATNVSDWVNVISVQVCMEFASTSQNYTTTLSGNTYTNCSGTSVTYPDNRARLVVRRTFILQNNIFTIPDAY